jgi:hypothetical protein
MKVDLKFHYEYFDFTSVILPNITPSTQKQSMAQIKNKNPDTRPNISISSGKNITEIDRHYE